MWEAIWQYEFLRNAFLAGILTGFAAPLLGVFIVVRRLSLIADALSHVALAGIAAGLLIGKSVSTAAGWNPLYIGMGFSVAGSLLIEKLRSVYRHYEELAIPIILSAGIGLSVILISIANGFNADLFSYLFGSVSAVSSDDVWAVFVVAVIAAAIIFAFYKELFLLSFDEEYARVSGVRAKFIHFLFIVLVALVIASSMRIVGVLLVSSLMTLPVAASIRIAKSFKQAIVFSIFFGELSVIIGLLAAYELDWAPGGTIVMLAVAILLLVLGWKKWKRGR
ncbi:MULTISPECIES: metal ABC transporter permease [Geobacillus]|uniref:High-affinity zinc uptake system membrane protein ZnuB n=2 Tax=Geobacillus thermodenitrificans TaxID=33940 RepID=A4IQZ8_GEOTN|nr:metal ABC transporter permease [Geobacillus thermodenitrificans]ABO67752.1 High-affinity zinc uptake system membrane protein ZnuB [Geobacillus thermodenitrificans NG80-2]MEC5187367.1 zinc transport system permease protein [Geobacillus thermodenitrificans]MED0662554.1 metal ABC transporter permease [Geobacillus thermodenitrificans]MED3716111.1 metal ABC transporter permease [Geobacillus thermodenitrificans]MED4918199.1 metal ABC transporter permease [Geobacillus thermodenitrificans]